MYGIEHDPVLSSQDPRTLAGRIEIVLRTLQTHLGACCTGCAGPLCPHLTLMSLVLGHQDRPRCLPCLATSAARPAGALGDALVAYIGGRECLAVGWQWAHLREPSCRWSSVAAPGGGSQVSPAEPAGEIPAFAQEWDAGEMSCGDLVLELRIRLRSMRPGSVLRVTARDSGAPEDMPAWCGLTGHTLVYASHPVYFIRRRKEE